MNSFLTTLLAITILALPLSLSAQTKSPVGGPVEPTIDDVRIPDITDPGMVTNGPEPLTILKATAVFANGQTWKGVIYLTNNTILTITNRVTAGSTDVRVLSIYSIDSIRVVRWTAVMETRTNLYRFIPSEYRIVATGTETNGLAYTGNIPVLNQFVFSDDNSKKTLYTMFYDRWVEGKKGIFRWENSLASSFPYNFTNPLPGVVVEIDFDRNF